MKFEYEECKTTGEVEGFIIICEGRHIQQVSYSTYHNALTQVCFGCKKVRSNISKEELVRDAKQRGTNNG